MHHFIENCYICGGGGGKYNNEQIKSSLKGLDFPMSFLCFLQQKLTSIIYFKTNTVQLPKYY